ncbi:MAG: TraR/DksA family transcriptional regulator [Acidimicrobiales bacterium]
MDDVRDSDAVRGELEAERDRLKKQVDELASDTDTSMTFDGGFADSGQVAAERGEFTSLSNSLRDQLDDVEAALTALDEGRYGYCEVCNEAIADARLEAMPATRRCIAHA